MFETVQRLLDRLLGRDGMPAPDREGPVTEPAPTIPPTPPIQPPEVLPDKPAQPVPPANPAGPPPEKTPEPEERDPLRDQILPKVAELLTDWLREDMAQGKRRSRSVTFPAPGKENTGRLSLENNQDKRYLRLGVFRKGTDRLIEHFISTGSNEETLDYIADPGRFSDWAAQLEELARKSDRYWE